MVTKTWDFPLLSFSGLASGGVQERNRRFGTLSWATRCSLGEHEAEGRAGSSRQCTAHAHRSVQSSQGRLGCAEARTQAAPAISVVVRLLGLTNKSSSSSLMVEPLIAATQVFDHMQQPDSPGVEQALSLLDHYDSKGFAALGGERSEVRREWTRLNKLIVQDEVLRALPLHELYSRLFLHFSPSYPHVLLLIAVLQARAIDANISKRCVDSELRAKDKRARCSSTCLAMPGKRWEQESTRAR